ncbi:hypothetical protein EON63_00220 [archaeon]|nr:MAG: hypothetical protein EON63_00220 [archaeon]
MSVYDVVKMNTYTCLPYAYVHTITQQLFSALVFLESMQLVHTGMCIVCWVWCTCLCNIVVCGVCRCTSVRMCMSVIWCKYIALHIAYVYVHTHTLCNSYVTSLYSH